MTWEDKYDAGEECLNGVKVLRFSVKHPRDNARFNQLNARLMGRRKINEEEWVKEQGPFVPELVAYIREHKNAYKCFVFFTYLYYTIPDRIFALQNKSHPSFFKNPSIFSINNRSVRSFPKSCRRFLCFESILFLRASSRITLSMTPAVSKGFFLSRAGGCNQRFLPLPEIL